jgi:hypothetical protein
MCVRGTGRASTICVDAGNGAPVFPYVSKKDPGT